MKYREIETYFKNDNSYFSFAFLFKSNCVLLQEFVVDTLFSSFKETQ
jgi:hypothetical protein